MILSKPMTDLYHITSSSATRVHTRARTHMHSFANLTALDTARVHTCTHTHMHSFAGSTWHSTRTHYPHCCCSPLDALLLPLCWPAAPP